MRHILFRFNLFIILFFEDRGRTKKRKKSTRKWKKTPKHCSEMAFSPLFDSIGIEWFLNWLVLLSCSCIVKITTCITCVIFFLINMSKKKKYGRLTMSSIRYLIEAPSIVIIFHEYQRKMTNTTMHECTLFCCST